MPALLNLYKFLTRNGRSMMERALEKRAEKGKEDISRLNERMGLPERARPEGQLLWIHAASVGEAQSALILIDRVMHMYPGANVMVTTGTVTSANLMAKRLPDGAFHQYAPLDHPPWVMGFLNHWQPDLIFWMESELWPSMLLEIGRRNIPAVLVNARLSDKSYRHWKLAPKSAARLISCFSVVLAQTEQDAKRFTRLGARAVAVTDNLKLSAAPLPHDAAMLDALRTATAGRPVWLYASTHDGEEALAFDLHRELEVYAPDLLTIIVPRHPDRGPLIEAECVASGLKPCRRGGETLQLPTIHDDVYIADTLGELGLFYGFSPIAVIGRSFSSDGGGGHNPVEAAQLGCAVVTGPNIQFQRPLYHSMLEEGAVQQAMTKSDLKTILQTLLTDRAILSEYQRKSREFAQRKAGVADDVTAKIGPFLHVLGGQE